MITLTLNEGEIRTLVMCLTYSEQPQSVHLAHEVSRQAVDQVDRPSYHMRQALTPRFPSQARQAELLMEIRGELL